MTTISTRGTDNTTTRIASTLEKQLANMPLTLPVAGFADGTITVRDTGRYVEAEWEYTEGQGEDETTLVAQLSIHHSKNQKQIIASTRLVGHSHGFVRMHITSADRPMGTTYIGQKELARFSHKAMGEFAADVIRSVVGGNPAAIERFSRVTEVVTKEVATA